MKNTILLLLVSFLLVSSAFAQSDIKLRHKYGAESADLQGILFFENIELERLTFFGSDLKNKDYQISIKKFVNGKLAQTDLVFDSKEVAYFKITSDQLALRIYAKATSGNTVKFGIQSETYRVDREYKVEPDQKEFALKHFLGAKSEQSIPLNSNTYILTFMMPYVKKDGSTTYCEVVQSDVSPEELGKKYPIPLYFLIDIKFQ